MSNGGDMNEHPNPTTGQRIPYPPNPIRPPQGTADPNRTKGVHELIAEVEELLSLANDAVKNIKRRVAEFDALQRRFYNGQ